MKNKLNRAKGSLLGLACGDAVGTTNEFCPKHKCKPIKDMVGGGVFKLKPGEWTDDTSMMICLAKSLIDTQDNNCRDQMVRYVNWCDHGHNSSNGYCFDIGGTVSRALYKFKQYGIVLAGSNAKMSAGNGSVMRIAPIALFYHDLDETIAMNNAQTSSRTTHQSQLCLEACALWSLIIHRVINSNCTDKNIVYQALTDYVNTTPKISKEIREVCEGSFKVKTRDQIFGSGYVVESIEAALWCFHNSNTFKEGVLLAANLGDDADTTAAIYGQIAGAFYGMTGIPGQWLKKLVWKKHIEQLAVELINPSN